MEASFSDTRQFQNHYTLHAEQQKLQYKLGNTMMKKSFPEIFVAVFNTNLLTVDKLQENRITFKSLAVVATDIGVGINFLLLPIETEAV